MQDDTRLARWLAGELEADERKALENSPEFETLSRIKGQFDKIKSPEFDSSRILGNVLVHEKSPGKVVPLYRKAWVRIAAMIVVLLGVGFTFFMPVHKITGNHQTIAFALPDDSQVVLNAGSAAEYSTWNWNDRREIALKGEAYFKVAKGKKFSVKTNIGTVTVLGTQFNVRARNGKFDVTCFEGKVRVSSGSAMMILLPGQGISISKEDAELLPVSTSQPEWLQGEIAFRKESFVGVIAELERQYDVRIEANFSSDQEFSGSVPADDLDSALKILSLAYHLDVTKTPDHIILKPVNAPR